MFQGRKFVICMNYNFLQVVPSSSVTLLLLFSFGEKCSTDWSLLNNPVKKRLEKMCLTSLENEPCIFHSIPLIHWTATLQFSSNELQGYKSLLRTTEGFRLDGALDAIGSNLSDQAGAPTGSFPGPYSYRFQPSPRVKVPQSPWTTYAATQSYSEWRGISWSSKRLS